MYGLRSPQAEGTARCYCSSDSFRDLRFGLPMFLAGANGGTDRTGASGRAAEVGQRAARVFAAGEPFGAVLGRRAQSEVCGLLARVVVAGVADGRVVVPPAEAGDDAVRELVSVQVPRRSTASSSPRPRGDPETGVARTGDTRLPEPALGRGRCVMDLGPVTGSNRLVSQPCRPPNRMNAHGCWFADEGELFVNGSGPGPHPRKREQSRQL